MHGKFQDVVLMAHLWRQCEIPTRQESFPYWISHRRCCHLCALLKQWTVFRKSGRTLEPTFVHRVNGVFTKAPTFSRMEKKMHGRQKPPLHSLL